MIDFRPPDPARAAELLPLLTPDERAELDRLLAADAAADATREQAWHRASAETLAEVLNIFAEGFDEDERWDADDVLTLPVALGGYLFDEFRAAIDLLGDGRLTYPAFVAFLRTQPQDRQGSDGWESTGQLLRRQMRVLLDAGELPSRGIGAP